MNDNDKTENAANTLPAIVLPLRDINAFVVSLVFDSATVNINLGNN